jgi:3'-phosphoadenosine 5'-phosphosulfate (PAPS) 3'-phosphatase
VTPLGGVLDKVAGVLQEVAAEVLEPLFARRAEMDTWDKAPGEVVTSGDIEAERRLARRLGDLLPGVAIIGEEATAADASLPAAWLAEAPRVWLVEAPRRYGELRRPLA